MTSSSAADRSTPVAPMGTPLAGTRLWPVTSIPPHRYDPRANDHKRDPLAKGCCHWAKEHPVHRIPT